MDTSQLSFGVAFLAGVASFLSPCVLALVPLYLAQQVGHSVHQSAHGLEERPARLTTFLHSLLFVLSFTLTFVAFGATASALGSFLRSYQLFLRQIGGILLVMIGLHLIGVLQWPIFYWQKHVPFHPRRPGYPASLLTGKYLCRWLDALCRLHARSYAGIGGQCGHTSARSDVALVLFAWVGSPVSARRYRSGPIQSHAQVAQAICGND